jgi:hypothetical protein
MIDRGGVQANAEFRRARARQLLCMEPDSEAGCASGARDALRRGQVEEAAIGEDVHEVGEPLARDGRDHVVGDVRRVLVD